MSRKRVIGIWLGLLLAAGPWARGWAAVERPLVGIWLKHAWMEEARTPDELRALAEHLTRQGATHVYVHIGPFNSEGRITRYKQEVAQAWLASLKRNAPGVKRLAWLGGRNRTSGGTVDLASRAYRKAMADEAARLLASLDFDGIHLNIEPLAEDDPDFVALLDELRDALGGKLISFAAPKMRPWWVPGIFGISERYWKGAAFERIMPHLDQVVVMVYDTAVPTAGLYQRYVAAHVGVLRQAHRASGAPQCQILVGLPTYDMPTWFHRPKVENLEMGLIGLLLGLNASHEPDPSPLGVAIYANWTTEEGEWETFRSLWLERFASRQ